MYRSVSLSRVSDDMQTMQNIRATSVSMDGSELSAYDPTEEIAKKERSRLRFAQIAVHFIPLVLIFCAFVLWLFSNPNVELGIKATESAAEKIDGLAIKGDINTHRDATQTSVLPVELGDTSKPKETNKALRKFIQRFK